MSDKPVPTRRSTGMAIRARDFAVLVTGALAIFALLAMTGALGLLEAVTSAIVLVAGALAFFVGSAPTQDKEKTAAPAEPLSATSGTTSADILDALPMPVIEIDPDGRVVAANAEGGRTFSLRPGVRAAAHMRSARLLSAIEAAQNGSSQPPVNLALAGSAEETWRAHVAPLPGTRNVLVVAEDLTPIFRAEQARADFLANASHELRTPLTSLAGFLETMRGGAAKDDVEAWPRFLDIMHGETERMSRLIADLLALSRIEFSEYRPPSDTVDLAQIATDAAEALQPLAAEKDIALIVAGAEQGLDVTGDADELIQVVQNLLSNALKYTEAGGEVILAYAHAEDAGEARQKASQTMPDAERMTLLSPPPRQTPGPAVWIRITDTGTGIAREHLPRLGERFYRADESRGQDIPGTGLGLAIVKHIMTRHRGGLAVESRPGLGSAFGVWMPVKPG